MSECRRIVCSLCRSVVRSFGLQRPEDSRPLSMSMLVDRRLSLLIVGSRIARLPVLVPFYSDALDLRLPVWPVRPLRPGPGSVSVQSLCSYVAVAVRSVPVCVQSPRVGVEQLFLLAPLPRVLSASCHPDCSAVVHCSAPSKEWHPPVRCVPQSSLLDTVSPVE